MKYFITIWLAVNLTSCSLMPEISLFEQAIEHEIATELNVGIQAIEQHNQVKGK